MGPTSFKSMLPSLDSMLLHTPDDVTMVDECKQSTNMWSNDDVTGLQLVEKGIPK